MASSAQALGGVRGPVVLVVPYDKRTAQSDEGMSSPSLARAAADLRCDEAAALVEATGYSVASRILAPRDDSALARRTGGYGSRSVVRGGGGKRRGGRGAGGLPVGKGKIAEIADAVISARSSVVVIDCELQPSHARQLRREIRHALRLLIRRESERSAIRSMFDTDEPLVDEDSRIQTGQTGAAGGQRSAQHAEIDLEQAAVSATNLTVTDRHGVILDIFARRARTREAKLQVELAAIERRRAHIRAGGSAELPVSATHASALDASGSNHQHSLDQQRAAGGGFGFIGGAGERQIELDRRRLSARSDMIREQLRAAERTRAITRGKSHSDGAHDAPDDAMRPVTVAMAGYTNAGKSHLARALTKDFAAFEPENALFATLGSTQRRLSLPSGASCRLIDTVGFVEGLPHSLVASFRSTLGDVAEADVLLHVRDLTHPRCQEHARVVDETIRAVVADAGRTQEAAKPFGGKSVIEVWTKLDLLTQADDVMQDGPSLSQAVSEDDSGREWEVVEQAALHGGVVSIEELSLLLDRSQEEPIPRTDSESQMRVAVALGQPSEMSAAGPPTILTSAVTGDGLGDVLRAIDQHVMVQRGLRRLAVVLDGGAESDSLAQAWLFSAHGGVSVTDAVSVCDDKHPDDTAEDGVLIRALVTPAALAKFIHMFPAQASRASLS